MKEMKVVWGLYLFSIINGLGFDSSHSITNLNEKFFSIDDCIGAAKHLNGLPFLEKQVGLQRGTGLRYVCIAKVSTGTNL